MARRARRISKSSWIADSKDGEPRCRRLVSDRYERVRDSAVKVPLPKRRSGQFSALPCSGVLEPQQGLRFTLTFTSPRNKPIARFKTGDQALVQDRYRVCTFPFRLSNLAPGRRPCCDRVGLRRCPTANPAFAEPRCAASECVLWTVRLPAPLPNPVWILPIWLNRACC